MKRAASLLFIALLAGMFVIHVTAADMLPPSLSDETFWGLNRMLSEPDGKFRYENLMSNETSYQKVIPSLTRSVQSGGVYIGVGPEQNFTYIAALEPKIAFIVDIRRQNTVELLMYKALFESSADRVEFLSQLFSRKRPGGLDTESTAAGLMKGYEAGDCDSALLAATVDRVLDRLMQQHGFALSMKDQESVRYMLRKFCEGGPRMDYGFNDAPFSIAPSYSELMTATDGRGQNWSYLATEANFRRVREMQLKNLIVPVTGDFAGPRTLRGIGAFLKRYNAPLTAFYISNVEQYLNKDQIALFKTNVRSLPGTANSLLIRFTPPESTTLESVKLFLARTGPLFHLLDNKN